MRHSAILVYTVVSVPHCGLFNRWKLFRMNFRNRTRILQLTVAVGLFSVLLGFVMGMFLDPGIEASRLDGWFLGIGFALLFLGLPVLVNSNCPSCKQLFCGPQDEFITQPGTNVFASSCKHCGLSIDQTE